MSSTEQKTSSSSRSSYKHTGEERFPLLLQLLEEERPKSTCGRSDSRGGSRVSNGVAMVLGRWPSNITTGCISAVFLTTIIMASIMMILTILVITTLHSNFPHRMILKREAALLEIETSCDYEEEEKRTAARKTTKFPADVTVFDYIIQSPLILKRDVHNHTKFQKTETLNAFFLTTEKLLSPYHVCSIESAARAMPNLTFYLIILSSHDKKKPNSDKRFDQLSVIYKNIKLYHLMGERYFHDSPIRGIFEKSKFEQSIIIFAARILTLWRYGGITFDMSLITTNNNTSVSYPIPYDYSVMLSDGEGTVMSVRMQCHSLLFEFLKTLAVFYKTEKYDVTKQDIIETALNSFCTNYTMKRESPGLCKGVSAMPLDLICNKLSEMILPNSKCIWSSVNGSTLYVRQQICPVAYHSHTLEEYKHENLIAHKRKVKFLS